MLNKLAAAVIAASTAIIPFSADTVNVLSPTNVYAEETGAVAKLPDWIPSDFDSAVDFRNTYGATHIDNGLICIVYPNRARKGRSSDTYGYELRTDGNSRQILKHDIYLSDMTETCFEVFVYQPQVQGDLALKLVDPHVQVKPSEKETGDDWEPPTVAEYTFNVDKELNITETDIFSWLPDSKTEYNEYTKLNGEVSVKDNYVVFCTMSVDQFGDKWEPASINKYENIKSLLLSDCTMQVPELYDDGSVDKIYVYQAVKDGYEKISWTRTSNMRPEQSEPTPYTLTVDCAVFDNAQSVLLADTARFSIVDSETGKLADISEKDKIFLNPDIRYSSDVEGVYASVDIAAPQMTSNPYYWDISQFKDADIFEIDLLYNNIPEGCFLDTTGTVVRKFDNGAIDYTFKLKKNSNSKKSTKITFYDADTGELAVIPEGNTYLLKCTSGTPSTSEIFDVETNPCTLESAYVYEKSCSYTFHTDSASGWYDSLEFEVISENSNSVELACKMKWTPSGDANGDGSVSVADMVTMQKWLLGSASVKLADLKAVDFCRDNKLDIFDLVLMRKALLKSIDLPVEVTVQESGGVVGAHLIYKVYCEEDKYFLSYQDLTFDREPESMIMQISEQEYREIMAQDYASMIQIMNDPNRPEWSEIMFVLELSYSDGSKNTVSSDRMPAVTTKLRALKEKYSAYVAPDKELLYGSMFTVMKDGLKFYLGPDESYLSVADIPEGTQLYEMGYQNDNDIWLFTKYNGQYGWLRIVEDDKSTITIYYDTPVAKPVIYLYPEKETDVHVELELTESDLSTTYPRYNNGWNVTASPDGSLLNKADGTHHKYLFWDAVNCRTRFDFSTGFCVAGGDTESFLREKLTYMGLTEEEMNEFIVYWLPLMEHNKYNLISFQGDVYTNSAKLNITPAPDSLLRVFMAYVPLEEAVDIQPQQLETFERKGFTVVEWGGTNIKA